MTGIAVLQHALGRRSVLTLDDIAEAVREQRGHVLTTDRSAIFVGVHEYPRSGERVAEAGPAVGDLNEILAAVPHIETWARAHGCTQAHVHTGRIGWERKLRTQGYEIYQTVLRKLLT